MKAISSAPSMKLTGTSTTPSRAVAKASTANCQQLWRQQRQPVALGQAPVGQRVRGPVDRGVELGEGRPQVPGDDGELVRVAARGAAQQVADAVPAGARDHRGGIGGRHGP